ncbi:hypothetical protein [Halostella pelagica]|uniref:hypothetical protein n=1 Tax=Halostella pelagica TaxID=2583824 RepID=UPI001081239E|nr:hypothetical protein [Halostella pelagica]
MYSAGQIRRGLRRVASNPSFFGRELNRLYYQRLYNRPYNTDGVDVVMEDWDNLLVLDGCRYDLFDVRHDLPGTLESRQSRGSHTVEFLEANFEGRTLHDTVYVTASPQLHRWRDRLDASFHDVINVWDTDDWNDEHGTVLPETMVRYAREANDEYPDKRLIVHFMQPHYPFINAPELTVDNRLEDGDGTDIWGKLMQGERDVSKETIWHAYRDNFDLVLDAVHDLLDDLVGKTVVTADHGNMIGERAEPVPIEEWGHPPGVYTDSLVTVPWLEYETGERKTIRTERPSETELSTDDTVTERLQQLGYAE